MRGEKSSLELSITLTELENNVCPWLLEIFPEGSLRPSVAAAWQNFEIFISSPVFPIDNNRKNVLSNKGRLGLEADMYNPRYVSGRRRKPYHSAMDDMNVTCMSGSYLMKDRHQSKRPLSFDEPSSPSRCLQRN